MKPNPVMRFWQGRAYCVRQGCERLLGDVVVRPDESHHVRLANTAAEGWVDGARSADFSPDWELKRRRQRTPDHLDRNPQQRGSSAFAEPGDGVVCPKCQTPQMVPLSR